MSAWPKYKTTDRMEPIDRYIEMCWAHNTAKTWDEQYQISMEAYAYKRALDDMGYRGVHLITEADMYFINLGVERPMCGGMLLDMPENGALDRAALEARAA